MTDLSPGVRADFFGKDRFTAFLGQVEDVDDPKHAGRVKVRCVGWHPKDKKELPTEDLPWSKVGAPTTHAQQNRIGGKHGLLVGCWVFGCFLDGEEAQDPFVISSFPFTAKAVEKDNRKKGDGKATASESAGAYVPITAGPEVENVARKTEGETGQGNSHPGDPAGALPSLDDSDSDCDGKQANQSVASKRMKQEMKKDNPEGQNLKVSKADGLCGPMAHAREDIQRNMEEMMPPQLKRFVYNDAVWDALSGDFTDSNGILQTLAQLTCSLLKQAANTQKAQRQEEARKQEAALICAAPDRDGVDRKEVEKKAQQKDDQMHAIFQETLIDVLCDIIMQLLRAMDRAPNEIDDDDFGGTGNYPPDSVIQNPDAICLTDNLLNNVNIIVQDTLDTAESSAQEYTDSDSSDSGDNNTVSEILGLLVGGMSFVLTQQYAQKTEVHNSAGSRSQDIRTKIQGCNPERLYSTLNGFINGGFGVDGGSGNDNNSDLSNAENFPGIGFGGSPAPNSTETVTTPCESATIPVVPDPGFDNDGNPIPVPPIDGVDPETKPDGNGGAVVPLPLPSDQEACAKNFINGVPNTIIVARTGKKYYYNNPMNPKAAFPTVYISGYVGRPVPVVDKISGELVSIITSCSSWPQKPQPPVSIIPDKSEIGISTDDPNYDIVIGGFHISNTGFDYCDPVIEIFDKDKDTTLNGEARPVVVEGRIVAVDVINNGTGFKRIPGIRVLDDGKECGTDGGFGAILYPIMNIIPKPSAKTSQIPIQVVYCPAHRQKNLY